MRRSLTISILIIVIAAMVQTAQANPLAAAAYFVLGQAIGDSRQAPVNYDTLGLNPIYNVKLNGKQVGANPDAKTIVAASARGCTLVFEPGSIGKVDIIGFEMSSNDPCMPEKIGLYADPKTIGKYFDYGDLKGKFVKEINPDVGKNDYVKCDPRYAKWQIPICTEKFTQQLYVVKIRVWYIQRRASGFMKTGRSTEIQREETLVKFMVCDPDYMQQAINDVDVQLALRASYGLVGGPVQISQPKYNVEPEVANQLNGGIISQPQPQPISQPVPVVQPRKQPTETESESQWESDGKVVASEPIKIKMTLIITGRKKLCIPMNVPSDIWVNQGDKVKFRNNLGITAEAVVTDVVENTVYARQAWGKIQAGDTVLLGGK